MKRRELSHFTLVCLKFFFMDLKRFFIYFNSNKLLYYFISHRLFYFISLFITLKRTICKWTAEYIQKCMKGRANNLNINF